MFFSIIVPVYNSEKYLNECIDSILRQKYPNFELVLINDGSTDRSSSILDEFKDKDSRVKVIHKENGGLPSARNKGLDIVTGDFILFIDSDDYISIDLLQILNSSIDQECDEIIQFGFTRNRSGIIGTAIQEEIKFTRLNYLDSLKSAFNSGIITWTVCNKAFKADFLKGLRFDDGARYFAEDVLFTTQAVLKSKSVLNIDYIGYFYRISENSMVTMGLNLRKFNSSMYAYFTARELFREIDRELFLMSDAFVCSSLLNWLFRGKEIIPSDVKKIRKRIQEYIRENILGWMENNKIAMRYKILGIFACVSLRIPDILYTLLSFKRQETQKRKHSKIHDKNGVSHGE